MYTPHPWEREYQNPQFLTLGTEPLSDIRDFMKWIKKTGRKNIENTDGYFSDLLAEYFVLDLGCGNGKNLKYIVSHFCKQGIGYDISETAITMARELALDLPLQYETRSIAEPFNIPSNTIDIILDATSSNALNHAEREMFLSEVHRVMKPTAYFFTRALCLDGDTNARNLVRDFPGDEPSTYILPGTGMVETVFSKEDFMNTYEPLFNILKIEKTTGYQKWGNQSYKRNYWVAYLQKK